MSVYLECLLYIFSEIKVVESGKYYLNIQKFYIFWNVYTHFYTGESHL